MRSITNVKISSAVTNAEKRRQRIVLGGGGVAIAVLSAMLFWPQDEAAAPASAVELAATPPAPVAMPAAQAVTIAPPAPAQPPANLGQYVLYGIGGGGEEGRAAVIGLPNGSQRVLPAGRTLTPGVSVKEVGTDFAILSTANGDMRLEFRKAAVAVAGGGTATPNAYGTPEANQVSMQSRDQDTLRYRLAMEPRRHGASISGYRIRSAASLPALSAAGLQAGDVLISVNGETLDSEERFHALAETLRTEAVARIAYDRAGRRIETELKIR